MPAGVLEPLAASEERKRQRRNAPADQSSGQPFGRSGEGMARRRGVPERADQGCVSEERKRQRRQVPPDQSGGQPFGRSGEGMARRRRVPERAHLRVRKRGTQAPTTPGPARPPELSFEADRLMIARRRTNIAQRETVFDEGGPSAPVASTEHEGVLADRTVQRFRVHAIASDRHPCHTHLARLGQRALPGGLERLRVGARNRSTL